MLRFIINWFKSPTFPEDEDKTRSAILLNVVLNTFLAALPVVIVGAILGGNVPRLERIITIVAIAWLTIFGTRRTLLAGKVIQAGMISTIILYIVTTLAIATIGTIRAPATVFYALLIVMSGLIISRRAIVWMVCICTVTIIALLLAEKNGFLPAPTLTVTIAQGVTFTVVFIVIGILLYLAVTRIEEALARARLELTERQLVEQEREKYIQKLDRQSAELERFTYTISHDLKSPVITIKGFLGMLQKDIQENNKERVEIDLKRISDAAEKMGSLLSELLELSRIGRIVNPTEQVDLGELMQEVLKDLDAIVHSNNVTIQVSSDLPVIYCDRLRLKEVYENLIGNAIRHLGTQSAPLIEIGMRKESETILFIKDNGAGIDPMYHEKIFGLFEKLDANSEGTGVGLALVKRIIETHGGKIWVESDGLGKGSTFCFTIPNDKSNKG